MDLPLSVDENSPPGGDVAMSSMRGADPGVVGFFGEVSVAFIRYQYK